MITSSFWRERRVFLTGHTGFKGAWLALMLERLNARVTGYALAPATSPCLYDLADVGRELCDVRGDVCDPAMLDGALRAADPDIVIHLATRPARRVDETPERDVALRLEGSLAVLDAAAGAGAVQTTLLVLPDARMMRGLSMDADCDARAFKVFCPDPVGGGDFAAPMEGQGHKKSAGADFDQTALHVLDACYGLLSLIEHADNPTGLAGTWSFAADAKSSPRERRRNRQIGWLPLLAEKDALQWTQDWRDAYAAGSDMRAFTFGQIDAYLGQRVRLTSPFAAKARAEERRALGA